MFYQLITAGRQQGQQTAIISARGTATWSEMADHVESLTPRLQSLSRRRVGLVTRPNAGCFAALAALDHLQCDVFLLDDLLQPEAMQRLARELQLGAIVDQGRPTEGGQDWRIEPLGGEQPGSGHGSVTILTSGTSGRPKAARHHWASLMRPVRRNEAVDRQRWLLTYRPQLYAGLQVVLQCFASHGTLVVPPVDGSPDQIARQMRDHAVQCCSATPSYWRRLVLLADHSLLGQAPLRQITLGGEIVDQQILDSLRHLFPNARIAHIYATTELGRCFSVTDGRAGFPCRLLDAPTRQQGHGAELSIRDGELYVRSANAMQSYDDHRHGPEPPGPSADNQWWGTGDLVEIRGDRVHFVGRRSDLINVGGNKVSPLEVERVVRQVAGVADARVFAKPSSIAGQLVACELVAAGGHDPLQVRQAVLAACQTQLASFQRPRFVDLVDQIRLTDAAKRLRREDQGPGKP